MPMDELISLLAASEGTYIVKEVRGTKGRNMRLLRLGGGSTGGHRDLLEMLKGSGLLEHRLSDVILQKYIERPLLVDKRKFDFRVYMLMVNACRREKSGSRSKAFYVYWHPGFLRLCIMAYQRDSGDLLCHLTNQHIQMNSVLYDRDYVRDVIYPKIGAIIGYLGAAFAESLNDNAIKANTFKLFGVDFMVDSRLSVQLLEVNDLPSWRRQTRILAKLKTDLWREAVALTVETVAKFRQKQTLEPLVSRCNFRLAHSSEDPTLLANAIATLFH
uniref:Tubulin--tyrosine ligase-like protein 9 n=1 Tax=Macrostomum lignano TaxID=282301 RepID=A0A1I8GE77_9PLAT